MTDSPHRREWLAGAGLTAAGLIGTETSTAADAKVVTNGRIQQSIVFWCFNAMGQKWSLDRTCQVARELGCVSVELISPDKWSTLTKHGLVCAIAPNGMSGQPFKKGWNNPRYHEELHTCTSKAIDACFDAGFPSVIGFTGYKYRDPDDPKSGEISQAEGAKNCIKALKKIASYAEKKKVTICIEHLNTRDSSHPMKGHPGYQGDDLDYLAGIIRKVGSARVKLLFDIYHVQIMHGDIIRRLEQNKDILGHVHTAGNPGRGELDDTQEINFPAIMKKLISLGYKGYVGQEFIPTRNPLEGLRQAVKLCDV